MHALGVTKDPINMLRRGKGDLKFNEKSWQNISGRQIQWLKTSCPDVRTTGPIDLQFLHIRGSYHNTQCFGGKKKDNISPQQNFC